MILPSRTSSVTPMIPSQGSPMSWQGRAGGGGGSVFVHEQRPGDLGYLLYIALGPSLAKYPLKFG